MPASRLNDLTVVFKPPRKKELTIEVLQSEKMTDFIYQQKSTPTYNFSLYFIGLKPLLVELL